MAATNVQVFSGDVEIASNVTAASSKFSLDTNGTLKQIGAGLNNNYIKLMKYFASGSNWKIATGSYLGKAWQWLSIRAKMTRLSEDVEIIQFNYFGSGGISRVRDSIVIGGGNASTQASEIKVYNKTSNSTYEIYLQIDSATSVEVEITHRGSTIDDDYSTVATANNGAIDETGLTKIYDSGTTTDLRLKQGNVGIGTNAPLSSTKLETHGNVLFDLSKGDTIPTGLYNYMSTQLLIDGQVYLSRGTTTASTDIEPPPGVAGDVICKFVNSTNTEAIVQSIPINMPVTTGDTIYFGGWYYAPSNHITIQHWGGSGGGPSVNYIVAGDATWRWIERTVTATSTGTIGYRIDNDTAGGTIYITGLTVRKNPSQTTGLPFTPRYSPHDGIGSVFTTQNIVAKEAAIKTLTGNVGIGKTNPTIRLDVGNALENPRIGRDLLFGGAHDADKRDSIFFGRRDGITADFLGMRCEVNTHTALGYGDYSNQTKISFNTWGNNYAGSREVMSILGSGAVGIGTASPGTRLEVNYPTNDGSVPILSLIRDGTMSATPGATFRAIDFKTQQVGWGPARHASINLVNYNTEGSGQFGLSQPSRQDTGLGFSVIENGSIIENALVINSAGSVGIGTTTPGFKLDVPLGNQCFINGVRFFTFGSNTANTVIDSGIPMKGYGGGGSVLLFFNFHNSGGDYTRTDAYILRKSYDATWVSDGTSVHTICSLRGTNSQSGTLTFGFNGAHLTCTYNQGGAQNYYALSFDNF
jgi:hypothetical protein